jgi:hypothetical protein
MLIHTRIEEITKDEIMNLENLLGFINQKKLHSYLNISNIMRLSKLDFSDLYFHKDLDLLFVRRTLLEKVKLDFNFISIAYAYYYFLLLNGYRTQISKTTQR